MSFKTCDAIFVYSYALEGFIRIGRDGSVLYL
jgi:hypothetical protein